MRLSEHLQPSDNADRKRPVGVDFKVDYTSTTPLPDADIAKARRAVAARATDAEDARLLLDTLGILGPATPQPVPAPEPSDCEPAMPQPRNPTYARIDARDDTYYGRHIADVPTKGLL